MFWKWEYRIELPKTTPYKITTNEIKDPILSIFCTICIYVYRYDYTNLVKYDVL